MTHCFLFVIFSLVLHIYHSLPRCFVFAALVAIDVFLKSFVVVRTR